MDISDEAELVKQNAEGLDEDKTNQQALDTDVLENEVDKNQFHKVVYKSDRKGSRHSLDDAADIVSSRSQKAQAVYEK